MTINFFLQDPLYCVPGALMYSTEFVSQAFAHLLLRKRILLGSSAWVRTTSQAP